jgi:hypothetical protein
LEIEGLVVKVTKIGNLNKWKKKLVVRIQLKVFVT